MLNIVIKRYSKYPFLETLNIHIKATVDNVCKWASELTLAVAWDLLESKSAAAICTCSRFILFVVALSFKSNLNWDQTVAGKVAAE